MRLTRLIEEKRNLRFWKEDLTTKIKHIIIIKIKHIITIKIKFWTQEGPGPPPGSVLMSNKEIESNGLP